MRHIELFLSTVSDEFSVYRDSLRHLLKRPNVDIHVQEDFIPTGTETLDKLDSYIARCDAIIHLVGDMTGSWAGAATLKGLRARYGDLAERLPPLKDSLDRAKSQLSYTQWEAYLAVYHRRPLVIAVPEPGTPRSPRYRVEVDQQASQRAHLERLRALGRHAEIEFGNGDHLAAQVFRSSILDILAAAGAELGRHRNAFQGLPEFIRCFSDSLSRLTENMVTLYDAMTSRRQDREFSSAIEELSRVNGGLIKVGHDILPRLLNSARKIESDKNNRDMHWTVLRSAAMDLDREIFWILLALEPREIMYTGRGSLLVDEAYQKLCECCGLDRELSQFLRAMGMPDRLPEGGRVFDRIKSAIPEMERLQMVLSETTKALTAYVQSLPDASTANAAPSSMKRPRL